MGATLQNTEQVTLKVYNSASTLKNLKITKSATLNLTSNIEIYLHKTALKDEALPADLFEKSSCCYGAEAKMADASIALEIPDFTAVDSLRTKVVCDVKEIDALRVYPQLMSGTGCRC